MTMGDRDYRSLIRGSIDAIGREIEAPIDAEDHRTIHLREVAGCLRRAYYDRTDPEPAARGGFGDLLSGLLRKLGHGTERGEFDLGGARLVGQADMIVDDAVMLYRAASDPPEAPRAGDLLYLNACLWIFGKRDGIVIYVTGDRRETSFSLSRDKGMLEEAARRARVLGDLLGEGKVPILEPSGDCGSCQYYQRCYIKEKVGKPVSIASMMGMGKG